MSTAAPDASEQDAVIDPVCGMDVDPSHPAAVHVHEGVTYYFCSTGCQRRFAAHPDVFAADATGPA